MIVLFGKSGSGKDTLSGYLMAKYFFTRACEVTTRQPREFETVGNPYIFLTEEMFETLKGTGQLAVYKDFPFIDNQNNKRKNYYGILKEILNLPDYHNTVLVTNAEMAFKLKKYIKQHGNIYDTCFVEIVCPVDQRTARLRQRGTSKLEIKRRIADEDRIYRYYGPKTRDYMVWSNLPIEVEATQVLQYYNNNYGA